MIYNTILIISFFILCCIPELEAIAKWYYYNKGAEHWCEVSDNCCGKRQSPIHLYPDPNTISQTEYPFKFIDYDKVPKAMKMTNNGHTVEIAISDDAVQPRLSGGGLPYTYKFHSFHFHWGSQLTNGSEHTLIGSRYPMEVHLLHYNENFTDIVAAQKSGADAAFAVLAVFIDKSNSGNPYILSLTEKLKEVKYMDDETNITQPFPLNVLLPRVMKKFYRYMGSLTTPGCNEIVVWNIFVTPIYLSQSQMKKFWDLHAEIKGDEPHPLEDNYRPIQSRHDRKVSIIWLRRTEFTIINETTTSPKWTTTETDINEDDTETEYCGPIAITNLRRRCTGLINHSGTGFEWSCKILHQTGVCNHQMLDTADVCPESLQVALKILFDLFEEIEHYLCGEKKLLRFGLKDYMHVNDSSTMSRSSASHAPANTGYVGIDNEHSCIDDLTSSLLFEFEMAIANSAKYGTLNCSETALGISENTLWCLLHQEEMGKLSQLITSFSHCPASLQPIPAINPKSPVMGLEADKPRPHQLLNYSLLFLAWIIFSVGPLRNQLIIIAVPADIILVSMCCFVCLSA